MSSYLFVVLTNPVAGSNDAEFNRWYDERHIPDVLNVPGIVAARRFEAADTQPETGERTQSYLALYNVETDDLQGVLDQLSIRSGTEAMPVSDTLDLENVHATVYVARA
jgi:hypothetical protein